MTIRNPPMNPKTGKLNRKSFRQLRAPDVKLPVQTGLPEVIGIQPRRRHFRVEGIGMLQGVGNVDDAGETELSRRCSGAGDGGWPRPRPAGLGSPHRREQISADLGVRGAKTPSVRSHPTGWRACSGFLHHGGILFGQAVGQNDLANVMHHPGAKSLFAPGGESFRWVVNAPGPAARFAAECSQTCSIGKSGALLAAIVRRRRSAPPRPADWMMFTPSSWTASSTE